MRRYIAVIAPDETTLGNQIPVNKACVTLSEAVKSSAADIIFTRLIKGESKIDGAGFSGNLEDLLNTPTSQYSIEELKWLASFFSGGAVFKRYQKLLDQLAPSDELKRTELLGIVNGIASLESFQMNYSEKIFEIGNEIISIGPKDFRYFLGTNEEFEPYEKMLRDLGFDVKVSNSGEQNNYRKYRGVPYWSTGKDAQGKDAFTKLSLPGVEKIYSAYSLEVDSHHKPISGTFKTDIDGLSVPFWTEEGEYKVFPGVGDIDLQNIRVINLSPKTRKHGVFKSWNYTEIYFWTDGKTGDYTTLSKWEGKEVIELYAHDVMDKNGTPGKVVLKTVDGETRDVIELTLHRQSDGTYKKAEPLSRGFFARLGIEK